MMYGYGGMGGGWGSGLFMGFGMLIPIALIVLAVVGVVYMVRGRRDAGGCCGAHGHHHGPGGHEGAAPPR